MLLKNYTPLGYIAFIKVFSFLKLPHSCTSKSLYNRYRMRLSLILSFYLAALPLFADDLDSRISTLESRMSAVKIENVQNAVGAKMASASPIIDGLGFYATADLLFWNLKEDGSDYALPYLTSSKAPHGNAKHAHFNWDFGFRTGVGYNLEHDAWDWFLNFTWFHTHANNTARAHEDKALSPQKGTPLDFTTTKMHSRWHIHYYVLDLEIGRSYFVSKYLAFRPQFGIESAWISQRRRYHLKGDTDPTSHLFGQRIYGKNNFWGIGPRAGMKGTWYMCNHFSLIGAVNGALQWGRFDDHLNETSLGTSGKTRIVDVDGDFHRLVPNVQMFLGFSWDANISEDENHLGILLSYEFQYWWRQNQFLNEQQPIATQFQHESKDLSINGVTLNVRYDF